MLALDIGGTKIACGIVDGDVVTHLASVPTPAREGGSAVLDAAAALAARVRDEHVQSGGAGIARLAVASAGVIDPVSGLVTAATDAITDWAGTNLRHCLATRLGLPTFVLNDVHAHALGEAVAGRGRGCSSLLLVAVGTGIGGGFVQDGQLLFGSTNVAGHVGHIDVAAADGIRCSCGRLGHVEAIASGTGLSDCFERATRTRLPGAEITRLADTDELHADAARRVLSQAGESLGRAIGGLLNVLNPDIVVLAGSVTKAGRRWWEAVADGVASAALPVVADTPVAPGKLDNAALVGAAIHARCSG